MAVDVQAFVQAQMGELRKEVGNATAINALSGGVDSSVVTVLGHRALGDRLNRISERITQIKGVNRCLYDLTPKPPATIEYV